MLGLARNLGKWETEYWHIRKSCLGEKFGVLALEGGRIWLRLYSRIKLRRMFLSPHACCKRLLNSGSWEISGQGCPPAAT